MEWSSSQAFHRWISERRWFPTGWEASVEITDSLLLETSGQAASGIVFIGAGGERFQLPLHLSRERPMVGEIDSFDTEIGPIFFQEGELTESYCSALFRLLAKEATLETTGGKSVNFRGPPITMLSPPRPVTLGRSSNLSIIVEAKTRTVLLKSFRKVERAAREPLILGLLTEQGYTGAPTLLGSVTAPDDVCLVEVLSYQRSDGDLGSHVVNRLVDLERRKAPADTWTVFGKLGEGLAQLHRSLGASDRPRFAPKTLTRHDLDRQIRRALEYYANSRKALADGSPPSRELRDLLESRERAIRTGLEDLRRAEGWPCIHIHDDLHLEQVLMSEGEPFFVDFEGEPIRAPKEKWERNSPLRDLATLLRSLSYVKHTALRQLLGAQAHRQELRLAAEGVSEEALRRLTAWEAMQREKLTTAYLAALREVAPQLLSAEEGEVPVLLQAWELEKALYELNYEVLYRPDYALIPLCALPMEG